MFVDSHCHLSFPELASDLPQIRQAMQAAQVDRALCICTTMEEFPQVHALATKYDNFWATVGVHPDSEGSPERPLHEPSQAELMALAQQPRVVAIGETGLDYYGMQDRKGGRSIADLEWQRERFRTHIRAACALDKPLIIHTRSAADDTLAILDACGSGARGVFHCFTETLDVAQAALERGFYISFSGILTFKNAQALRDVAAQVPLDRLLIETDSPYLAPVPYRGKRNSPAYVPHVAAQLASIKGVDVASIANITSANFDALFFPQHPTPPKQEAA